MVGAAMNLWQRLRVVHRAWRYRIRCEPQEIAFVRAQLSVGDTAIDIGAHQGAFTYWMQKQVGPIGRVIALEPQPEMADFLQCTKQAFQMRNVTIVNAGLSAQPGQLTMYRPEDTPSACATFQPGSWEGGNSFCVPVETLDRYCTDHDLRPVSFIKCDVEGHELPVFRGAATILQEDQPVLLFECEERMHHQDTMQDVFDMLLELGYDGAFFRHNRQFPLDEFRYEYQQTGMPRSEYANNFVFLPRDSRPAGQRRVEVRGVLRTA